ncbi:DUF4062 domain-containing protein [Spirosoma validum]|uniref:DUF4062 domain-containing protein n=1 Tax=Spirosoma validum TaxID=2771355 RepID=A0A927GCL5_9BACT|nr:DUF4062 domain-containing protein [Spirosoma validum]MBD2752606.1 DUF4062 domain-containing protein [Spirosoma validum]
MAQRRKLQVFVSSTYIDLIEERQAAVEAILTAGHIPAGMELFAGQNEEQMNIIKRWIDESDIYLLLFGGRYGSIEVASQKSYTHLEFDYAKESGKPVFVIVAEDSYITQKAKEKDPSAVMELQNRDKYLQFRNAITGKYVKNWTSIDSLKLAIINTIHILEDDENLVGWISGREAINTVEVLEQLSKLNKENTDLRLQLSALTKPENNTLYNGLTFDQMYSLLNREVNIMDMFDSNAQFSYGEISKVFGDERPSLLHVLVIWGKHYIDKSEVPDNTSSPYSFAIPSTLHTLGILKKERGIQKTIYQFTSSGGQFYLRLRLERDVVQAEEAFNKYYRLFNVESQT